jgi:probable phosphoglycerate mutase
MSDLPTVYLARHGETAWSKSGQHTGRTDIPLTERGEEDAYRLRHRFAAVTFARAFTSPLQRAARTAALAGYSPEVDPELLEWDYGQYEGRKSAEIRAERPDWELFRDGAPGGESPEQVTARADRVVARLKGLSGNVLVFSHGHFLRVLAARWLGQPVTFARCLLLSTASASILSFDHHRRDEPAIALWNDDRHLVR